MFENRNITVIKFNLRIVVRMFMDDPLPNRVIGGKSISWPISTFATIAVLLTVLMGTVLSAPVFDFVRWGSQHLVVR